MPAAPHRIYADLRHAVAISLRRADQAIGWLPFSKRSRRRRRAAPAHRPDHGRRQQRQVVGLKPAGHLTMHIAENRIEQ
jgi:hypothetical protein